LRIHDYASEQDDMRFSERKPRRERKAYGVRKYWAFVHDGGKKGRRTRIDDVERGGKGEAAKWDTTISRVAHISTSAHIRDRPTAQDPFPCHPATLL
jgi:hypothetical protein